MKIFDMKPPGWAETENAVVAVPLMRKVRPAHIHFKVEKDGFDPLITHVFKEGDGYLDADAVFGVRGSCIGDYVRHEGGMPPFGEQLDRPFFRLDCRFSLHPLP